MYHQHHVPIVSWDGVCEQAPLPSSMKWLVLRLCLQLLYPLAGWGWVANLLSDLECYDKFATRYCHIRLGSERVEWKTLEDASALHGDVPVLGLTREECDTYPCRCSMPYK